jgi:hypothetical protein
VNRLGIAVLGILNQKHHQKSDNRRGGIDHELPGVGKMENRSGGGPDRD